MDIETILSLCFKKFQGVNFLVKNPFLIKWPVRIWSYSLFLYPQCIAAYRGPHHFWGTGGKKKPLQRVNGNAGNNNFKIEARLQTQNKYIQNQNNT